MQTFQYQNLLSVSASSVSSKAVYTAQLEG